ncbi:hypothetical protein V8C86DRAFT_3107974 [Haematococcus lacustris]
MLCSLVEKQWPQYPGLLLLLLLLLLLTPQAGLAELGVVLAAQQQASAQRHMDEQLAGLAVEGIAAVFREAYWMVLALKAQVLATPSLPDLRRLFNQTATELIAKVRVREGGGHIACCPQLVKAMAGGEQQGQQQPSASGPGPSTFLMLLPMGRMMLAYPDFPLAGRALGMDFLATPAGRDPRFAAAFAQGIPLLQFFHRATGGVNVSATELFGMPSDVSYCPNPAGCYDPVQRTRFWGGALAAVDLGVMFTVQDVRLRRLREEGLEYQLLVPASVVLATLSPAADMVVTHSPGAGASEQGGQAEVVTASAMLPSGDKWTLRVWRPQGHSPAWRTPLLAVLPLVCLLMAAELLVVLVVGLRLSQLVQAMLPPPAARCLAAGQEYAQAFEAVTILFADICSYTALSSQLTPRQVVALLGGLYQRFDALCEQHGVYKSLKSPDSTRGSRDRVEIVGDCWMAASGAFPACPPREAALRAARLARDMVREAREFAAEGGRRVQIRVGLASGPVFASVISHKMPHVTLIGDTTNVAARMESSCEPMHIHVAESTVALLRSSPSPTSPSPCPNPPLDLAHQDASLPGLAPRSPPPDASRAPSQHCYTSPLFSATGPDGSASVGLTPQAPLAASQNGGSHSALGVGEGSRWGDGQGGGSGVEVADPLTGGCLRLLPRGLQHIKGKGRMATYWLSPE